MLAEVLVERDQISVHWRQVQEATIVVEAALKAYWNIQNAKSSTSIRKKFPVPMNAFGLPLFPNANAYPTR